MYNNGALCCNRIDIVVVPPIKHFFAKKREIFLCDSVLLYGSGNFLEKFEGIKKLSKLTCN